VTASDLFLLLWDDYGWSSDIGGLTILDGTGLLDPEGRVRIEAVRARLEPRLNLMPGSGSCCTAPAGAGLPLWVDAHVSTSPTTSGSTRLPPPAAKPRCWPPARNWCGG
jgi:hypothetical protein